MLGCARAAQRQLKPFVQANTTPMVTRTWWTCQKRAKSFVITNHALPALANAANSILRVLSFLKPISISS